MWRASSYDVVAGDTTRSRHPLGSSDFFVFNIQVQYSSRLGSEGFTVWWLRYTIRIDESYRNKDWCSSGNLETVYYELSYLYFGDVYIPRSPSDFDDPFEDRAERSAQKLFQLTRPWLMKEIDLDQVHSEYQFWAIINTYGWPRVR
jgi:hypothetical protein